MTVINTNTGSLYAQQAMNTNSRGLAVVMQQLSTGKRINNAVDDVAGLAISTRLTSQIKGLNQAVRNANDAISLIQTAEGATEQVTNMLQRMRELSIQASNDTNNDKDRGFLDLEFQQLKDEIDRIGMNTQWNGKNILDGTAGKLNDGKFTFQIGANANQTIELQLPNLQSAPKSSIALSGHCETKAGISTFSILNPPVLNADIAETPVKIITSAGVSAGQVAEMDFTNLDTDGVKRLGQVVTATVNNVEYEYTIDAEDIAAAAAGGTELSTRVADAIADQITSPPTGYTVGSASSGKFRLTGPVNVSTLSVLNTKVNGLTPSATTVTPGTAATANVAVMDFTSLDTDGVKRFGQDVSVLVDGDIYKYAITADDVVAAAAGGTALSTRVAAGIAAQIVPPSGYTVGAAAAGKFSLTGTVNGQINNLLNSDDTKLLGVSPALAGLEQAGSFGPSVYVDLSALNGVTGSFTRGPDAAYELPAVPGATDNVGPQSRLGMVVQATVAGKAVQYKITQADVDASKDYDQKIGGGKPLSVTVAKHLADKLNDQYVGLPFSASVESGVLVVQATGLESFSYYDTETSPGGAAVYSVTGDLTYIDPSANIKDGTRAAEGLARIDSALQVINEARSKMGAVVSRLQFAADNLFNVSAKATESRSRIEDTDYSQASTELAKRNIIQQAAQAMLAQANQAPQLVLQLLK